MMIEHTIGRFVHRYDPVLVARLLLMRRREEGEIIVVPKQKRLGPSQSKGQG